MEADQSGQETRMPVQRVPPGTPGAGKGGIIPPHPPFAPGNRMNPGGRPKGYSVLHEIMRDLAQGAEIDADGEVIRSGLKARELAQALLDVASGKRAPEEIDTKAALAILDRTDGPVVKEIKSDTTLTVEGGIELFDRRASAKDLPR